MFGNQNERGPRPVIFTPFAYVIASTHKKLAMEAVVDMRFQAIIEAVVRQAKAQRSLLWADEFAARIVSSTPLDVRADDISQQISQVAAGEGVPVTVMGRPAGVQSCCGQPA